MPANKMWNSATRGKGRRLKNCSRVPFRSAPALATIDQKPKSGQFEPIGKSGKMLLACPTDCLPVIGINCRIHARMQKRRTHGRNIPLNTRTTLKKALSVKLAHSCKSSKEIINGDALLAVFELCPKGTTLSSTGRRSHRSAKTRCTARHQKPDAGRFVCLPLMCNKMPAASECIS